MPRVPFFALATLLLSTAAFAAPPPHALEHLLDVPASAVSEFAMPGHARSVALLPAALDAGAIRIELFDGEVVTAHRTRWTERDAFDETWVGTVAGWPGSHVSLTQKDGALAGSILFSDRLYELRDLPGFGPVLTELDPDTLPDEDTPPVGGEPGGGAATSAEPPTAAETTYVADLLVVYTQATRARYGQAGIEAMITTAVADANTAYGNSLIDASLNLVHTEEIAYVETGDMGTALSRIQSTSDGFMDSVHALRDSVGADIVALIDEDTNYCGIGYVMTNESSTFGPWAFSVTYSGCLSNQTLAHEIGHNQGDAHDRSTGGTGVFAYSYGYRRCMTDGSGFRTVMAYSCTGGTRVLHFSNPDVNYLGNPTGIAHAVDPANSADNALSMNLTADTWSTFRPPVVTSPPAAPASLSATANGWAEIDLAWLDNATNETGFTVERSPDAAAWSVVASLGANTGAWTDTSVSAATTYHYRVQAWNSAGVSAWSNSASATTDPLPSPPATVTGVTATALSASEIDVAWSDVADEESYRVERSDDDATWSTLTTRAANTTAYTDSGLNPGETWYYRVVAINGGGESTPSASASDTTDTTVEVTATSSSTIDGTVTGSVSATDGDDGATQVLTESETGGKPSNRRSRGEIRWSMTLPAGTSAVLHANAWRTGSGPDDFDIDLSTDGGGSWTNLFTVSSGSSANLQSAALPSGTTGAVLVRGIDTDRAQGERALDSLHVDDLYVAVENDPNAAPPAAPTFATATVVDWSTINLSWGDGSTDETGFEIEVSADGGAWAGLATVPVDIVVYTDSAALPSTDHEYRVRATNGAGSSAWVQSNLVTTPAAPAGPSLSASPYKVKGVQNVDLTWTGGAGGDIDIFRDGALIVTTADDGLHTDNIGAKGGGTYAYEVCDAGTAACSGSVTVVF